MIARLALVLVATALAAAQAPPAPPHPPHPPAPPGPPSGPCGPDKFPGCAQLKERCTDPAVESYCPTTCCGVKPPPGPNESCGAETLKECSSSVEKATEICDTTCKGADVRASVYQCVDCVTSNLTALGLGGCCGCVGPVLHGLYPSVPEHVRVQCASGPKETCGRTEFGKCGPTLKTAWNDCYKTCTNNVTQTQCVDCLVESLQSQGETECCGCIGNLITRVLPNLPDPGAAANCKRLPPAPPGPPSPKQCSASEYAGCATDIAQTLVQCSSNCVESPETCFQCIIKNVNKADQSKCCACIIEAITDAFPTIPIPPTFSCH